MHSTGCRLHDFAMVFERVSRHPSHTYSVAAATARKCIIYILLEWKFTNASPLSFATISFIFFGTQDTIINSSCAHPYTHTHTHILSCLSFFNKKFGEKQKMNMALQHTKVVRLMMLYCVCAVRCAVQWVYCEFGNVSFYLLVLNIKFL